MKKNQLLLLLLVSAMIGGCATPPPPAAAKPRVLTNPVVTHQTRPVYPAAMVAGKFSGEVLIDFVVDPQGVPTSIVAAHSTRKEFEGPAIAAVKEWKFTPATADGVPVKRRMVVPVVFSLEEEGRNQKPTFQLSPGDLVGHWTGADTTGKKGEMQFFANGQMMFVIDEMRIGGPSAGSPFDATYTVDATKSPWHLDIVGMRNGVKLGVLRGILEAIDESTIRVGLDTTSKRGFGDARPVSFTWLKPESIMVLKKEPGSKP